MKNDQPKKPEFFVSRRGKHVGVHELNLNDIDIEDTKPKTSLPKEKSARKERRVRSGPGRRTWFVIFAVIAALLIVPVIAGELVAAEYRSGAHTAKTDLEKVVNTSVLPAQKKDSISADQLRGIAGNVNDIVGRMCRGGFLDNAAQLYPRAKSAYESCKDSQRDYATLTARLYDLEAQARYMEKLGTIIKPITAPITDAYAVIGSQQSSWQDAAKAVKDLSAPQPMKTAHTDLSNHIGAVADAWSKLNTANNAEDAAAFTEAEQTLTTEYEAVRSSSSQLLEVVHDTQLKLRTAYAAIK